MISEIKGLPVILDSDAANKIDDLFAVAYAALSENVRLEAVLAAPFTNSRMMDPAEGMELSLTAIRKILEVSGSDVPSYAGAPQFMPDDRTPVDSPAVQYLIDRLRSLPEGEKAVVCAIGCGTNAASALMAAPDIAEKMILVWQAGHSFECTEGGEFNLCGDQNASQAIFASDVPLILIPAYGAASVLGVTARELRERMADKNLLCRGLYRMFCDYVGVTEDGVCYDTEKIVWDIASVGLIAGCPMTFDTVTRRIRADEERMFVGEGEIFVCRGIDRDAVYEDMYRCIGRESE